MKFVELRNLLLDHFNKMVTNVDCMFEVQVNKDEMWELYLDSFNPESNKIFRVRKTHDCSSCRHFIKSIGNAVVIKGNHVETIWDFKVDDPNLQHVLDSMSNYIKSHPVTDVYFNISSVIGCKENFEMPLPSADELNSKPIKWEHFYVNLPGKFVKKNNTDLNRIKGEMRDIRNVFKRSLEEISEDAIMVVLELISQNSLYKGEEWKDVLNVFLTYKRNYMNTMEEERENFAWEKSIDAGPVIGKIRNHSIGTLLTNITEGMDLDVAVRKYEQIVAPANYKRPKPIYTQKMLDDARKTIEDLGYMGSLERRFATIDDLSVNNILFINRDSALIATNNNVFDEMKSGIAVNPKSFSKVEEIQIDKFIKDVLPTITTMELLFESRLSANMVSLTVPKNKESKNMFKWNNSFGWAYVGNITDSSMKERVKAAGGNVDGDLRFSIQWNELDNDKNDLDAHCIEPTRSHIFFQTYKRPGISPNNGQLDVDIINPDYGVPAVENITYFNKNRMAPGIYQFFVNCYTFRGGRTGFRAEIEFDGQIHSFEYNQPLREGENVKVADVLLTHDGTFSILNDYISSKTNIISKEIWGIKTNQFVPVSVIMNSPNYWDGQNGVGNRHYFFMVKDCKNPEKPNGFYNEFLNQELDKHKRVLEALGSKMKIEDSDEQLSGFGFSSTKRNYIIVKVKGAVERALKIIF